MHDVTAIFLAAIVIGLPTIFLMVTFNRFFKLREKKLEVEALNAAEKLSMRSARNCFAPSLFSANSQTT